MTEFILSEVENLFNVPQHVLIHLCEKEVVVPEIQETNGRGRFRKFSAKNMFEFAVALELKKYQIPLTVIKALLIVLSAAFRKIRNEHFQETILTMFQKLQSDLYIFEGMYIVFRFEDSSLKNPKGIMLGVDLKPILEGAESAVTLERFRELPSRFVSHLKINLSELAVLTLRRFQ